MGSGLSRTDEGQNTEGLHMKSSRTATAMFTTILALGGLTACGDSDTLSDSERDQVSKAALAATGGGRVTAAEKTDDDAFHAYDVDVTLPDGQEVDVDLDEDFKVVGTDPAVIPTSGAPSATATPTTGTSTGDDDDLTGQVLADASKAALAETGGGRITDSSANDDVDDDDGDHAYEVEVTLDNGDEVSVDLDKNFKVVRTDTDRND